MVLGPSLYSAGCYMVVCMYANRIMAISLILYSAGCDMVVLYANGCKYARSGFYYWPEYCTVYSVQYSAGCYMVVLYANGCKYARSGFYCWPEYCTVYHHCQIHISLSLHYCVFTRRKGAGSFRHYVHLPLPNWKLCLFLLNKKMYTSVLTFLQGWEFAHSHIAHSLIASFAQITQIN